MPVMKSTIFTTASRRVKYDTNNMKTAHIVRNIIRLRTDADLSSNNLCAFVEENKECVPGQDGVLDTSEVSFSHTHTYVQVWIFVK